MFKRVPCRGKHETGQLLHHAWIGHPQVIQIHADSSACLCSMESRRRCTLSYTQGSKGAAIPFSHLEVLGEGAGQRTPDAVGVQLQPRAYPPHQLRSPLQGHLHILSAANAELYQRPKASLVRLVPGERSGMQAYTAGSPSTRAVILEVLQHHEHSISKNCICLHEARTCIGGDAGQIP